MRAAVWTALTTLGLAGGIVAGLLLDNPLGEIVNAMIVTAAVTCTVGGVLGGAQSVGLRGMLRKPLWWIVATIAGIGIGLALGVVIVEQVGIAATGVRPNLARISSAMRALSFVTVGLVAGTVLGLAQWVVLRAQSAGIRHWIPASGLGLAVALTASSLLVDASGLRFASAAGGATFVLASGLVFGLLTSWPLASRPAGSRLSS
jgi:hypothetical protein